ncbi:MAG: hypothetical protein JHC31_11725 [Sulfurihydrogenibium sp.]|jgi:hypothetical protein|nr:hypothetical protein [Sulfurihydrogenibium sp.]
MKNFVKPLLVLAVMSVMTGCATTQSYEDNENQIAQASKGDLTKAVELLIRDVGSIKKDVYSLQSEHVKDRETMNEVIEVVNSITIKHNSEIEEQNKNNYTEVKPEKEKIEAQNKSNHTEVKPEKEKTEAKNKSNHTEVKHEKK